MLAYTLLDFPWVSLYFLSGWQIPFQALLEHLTPCVLAGCACRDSSCLLQCSLFQHCIVIGEIQLQTQCRRQRKLGVKNGAPDLRTGGKLFCVRRDLYAFKAALLRIGLIDCEPLSLLFLQFSYRQRSIDVTPTCLKVMRKSLLIAARITACHKLPRIQECNGQSEPQC